MTVTHTGRYAVMTWARQAQESRSVAADDRLSTAIAIARGRQDALTILDTRTPMRIVWRRSSGRVTHAAYIEEETLLQAAVQPDEEVRHA